MTAIQLDYMTVNSLKDIIFFHCPTNKNKKLKRDKYHIIIFYMGE
jgi:hypothetical protein